MHTRVRRLLTLASLPIALALSDPNAAFGQGDLVESTREKPKIKRTTTTRPKPVARAANGLLVIASDLPNADVSIDGRSRGPTNADGEFQIELPANREYRVTVSAGDDYIPYERSVRLSSRVATAVDAELRFRYALLIVGPLYKGSRVLFDGKPLGRVTEDAGDEKLRVDGIPPGSYELTYEVPGYMPVRRPVALKAGGQILFTPRLERAAVELIVQTAPGASVYVDSEDKGVAPSDGKLRVRDVPPGRHEVLVKKTGFSERKHAVDLAVGAPVTVDLPLTAMASAKDLFDDFGVGLAQWVKPAAGWSLVEGELAIANCPSPGLSAGHYRDFALHFELTLTNGGGAAWALRATDPNSYYLFYLSGPNGRFKNRFVVYVVRNGKLDPDRFESAAPLPAPLAAKGYYSVDVDVAGGKVTTFITAENTSSGDVGRKKTIGVTQIDNDAFPIGQFGFRTVASEEYAVDNVVVNPK